MSRRFNALPVADDPGDFNGEAVYREDVRRLSGKEPSTPFMDLSDMAIQMYEIEADMLNQQKKEDK